MKNILSTTLEMPAFMATEPKKPKTITFEPDEDVGETLAQLLADMGNPYGMRSKVINDILRDGLPQWRTQTLAALKGKRAA